MSVPPPSFLYLGGRENQHLLKGEREREEEEESHQAECEPK